MSLFRLAPVLVLGLVVASGFPVHGAPPGAEPRRNCRFAFHDRRTAVRRADRGPRSDSGGGPRPKLRNVGSSSAMSSANRSLGILTETQNNALLRAEAGQMLLAEGVEGLKVTLAAADVPAITFDQETQVRSVYEEHARALEDLLRETGGNRSPVEPEIRALEDQLLLAALKFPEPGAANRACRFHDRGGIRVAQQRPA